MYAGESLVPAQGITHVLDTLREKGLLVEKTMQESETNKAVWKKAGSKKDIVDEDPQKQNDDESAEETSKPAWAVDLGVLGKPVLQKPSK